jgi:hypothetical protein
MMGDKKTTRGFDSGARKEYARPQLQNYGSLKDLTLGGENFGADSGICNPGDPNVNKDNCS